MLDPDEVTHVELITAMHSLEDAADGSDDQKLDQALGLVGEWAHRILKSEWERPKDD